MHTRDTSAVARYAMAVVRWGPSIRSALFWPNSDIITLFLLVFLTILPSRFYF
jgi:hypothetical protein